MFVTQVEKLLFEYAENTVIPMEFLTYLAVAPDCTGLCGYAWDSMRSEGCPSKFFPLRSVLFATPINNYAKFSLM